MTRQILIAAVQLPAWIEGETVAARQQQRLATIEHWLAKAGEAGATLACLGETCMGNEAPEDAYTGMATVQVQALARRYQMHVVLPLLATVHGRLRNLALVIDDSGAIAGAYVKVHPTRTERQRGVIPGDDFPVFDLGFGRVGVCICHDLSFPESTRVLTLRGAEIIVWPTWWSGWGEELCYAVIKSRAIDNGAWLVTASFGIQPHLAHRPGMVLGRSGVIGPDGLELASAGRYPGLALCPVDLDHPRRAHSFTWAEEDDFRTSVLADRRPDTYSAIADAAYLIDAIPPSQRTTP